MKLKYYIKYLRQIMSNSLVTEDTSYFADKHTKKIYQKPKKIIENGLKIAFFSFFILSKRSFCHFRHQRMYISRLFARIYSRIFFMNPNKITLLILLFF
jgi:hypothetical protein